MEILIVVLLLAVVAALVFAWMKFRRGAFARGMPGRRGGVYGRGRRDPAAGHESMAEAVERHAAATDPHEAAEEELRLRAQANRVASELHAREADALESTVGTAGGHEVRRNGVDHPLTDGDPRAYDDGTSAGRDDAPAYLDEHGRPVYEDERPRY